MGFLVFPEVRHEANGGLLAPELLSYFWVISCSEDGDSLICFETSLSTGVPS